MISLTLFCMAVEDLLTMKVTNIWQGFLLVAVIATTPLKWELVMMSLVLYLGYRLLNHQQTKIGGADIKIFCTLLLLGYINLLAILVISSFLGILYCVISKQKKIPFVPFIWIGYTIVNF